MDQCSFHEGFESEVYFAGNVADAENEAREEGAQRTGVTEERGDRESERSWNSNGSDNRSWSWGLWSDWNNGWS